MRLLMQNGGISPVFLIAPLVVVGLSACDGGRRTDVVVTESTVGYVPVGAVTAAVDPVVTYSPSADAMVDVGVDYRYTTGYTSMGSDLVAPGVIYGPGNYHDSSRPFR
jgi:hypothetical protein